VESSGGRLFGEVVWTYFLPVIVAGHGMARTMTILAVMPTTVSVVVFAPETYRRSVETLEAAAIGFTKAATAANIPQAR
jgi:hypothetical protein